jgi:ABC-type multidrug transport system fused ATPase/permease subunit
MSKGIEDLEPRNSGYQLQILKELFRGKPGQAALLVCLAVISTAATLALPMFVGGLVGAIQQSEGLTTWTLALVVAGIGSAVAGALGTYLLSRMGLTLIRDLRAATMRWSLRLQLSQARQEGAGSLTTRLTMDAARLKSVIDVGPIQLPMAVFTLIGTLVIMGVLDLVMLLITIAAFVIAIALVALVVIGLRRRYISAQEELGGLARHFVAALNALTVIKANRAEQAVAGQLTERAHRVSRLDISAARMESLLVPVITFSQQLALVTVIIAGGSRLIDGSLPLGDFVAFLIYLLQLTAPLIFAATGVSSLQVGLAARKRFNDLFAMPVEDLRESTQPVDGVPGAPAARFDNVQFSYDGVPALRGADFTVPVTGLTAMVGSSGAGKTTTLSLIERFVDPDSGRIEILGRTLDDWPLNELRKRIAYVDQTATLLQASVRDNLTIGMDMLPSDEELYRALDRVGLATEIRNLPRTLDTVLDGATDLSGGQRQRLALARAALSGAPLIILDEPSSQLDSANEHKLRSLVDELAEDRAVLVVAHRISTVQHATSVIVLDSGQVMAEGRHQDLMRDCTHYADLVNGQMMRTADPELV